jgi:hypothetical protein
VNVGDHGRQLQVPVLQQLLDPLFLGGAGLGEVAAVAGVGAEPADRLGRHETGRDHPPLGDLGEPDGVGPVFGLPGSALTCAALYSSQSNPRDSSTKNTGFQ